VLRQLRLSGAGVYAVLLQLNRQTEQALR